MKHFIQLVALASALIFAGCKKSAQQEQVALSDPQTASVDKSSSGSSGGNINLMVDVDPTSGNKVLSDNGGSYSNGSQLVQAQILSSDGNFYMNTNSNTAKPSIRSLLFLADDPQYSTSATPNLTGEANYSLRTDVPYNPAINPNGTKGLQNMNPSGDQQYMQFRVLGIGSKGIIDWRLVWKNGYESDYWNPSSPSDYVLVTRLGNVWTIQPADFDHSGNKYAALRPGNDNSSATPTYYHMPFKLTLTKIN